jgi:hypothetical protein
MTPAYIPAELRRQVRADAAGRCGYCHSPETLIGMPLEFEHVYPEARGGPTTRENLWLACTRCNDHKGDRIDGVDPESGERVPVFNPRTQIWVEHFAWSPDGALIVGLTPIGRATVAALRLNNEFIVVARRFWVEAGWWPAAEDVVG